MEDLLTREMPTGRRGDRRRWFLLVLLLLLLIGVCNCPGRKWFFAGKKVGGKTEVGKIETVKTGEGKSGPDKAKTGSFPAVTGGGKAQGGPSVGGVVPGARTGDSSAVPESGAGIRGADPEAKTGAAAPVPGPGETVRRPKPSGGAIKQKRVSGNDRTVGEREGGDSLTVAEDKPNIGDSTQKKQAISRGAPKTTAKTPPAAPKAPPKETEKKERQDGWMVGIGLNQFFTVGGQQQSSFNSGGITGTLGDYIPVPMGRYYFNPKLYVQLEAQINTPQYTKKNLVAVSTPVDSIGATITGATITVQKSVSINKLFYFNVPLSVHYTVFDHLDLGGGLQYSRLTNGVGIFNNNYNTGGTDSLSTETKSFKGDSVYREIKTHEFRFLVDANYTWEHFIFGIRYNQALSKFIHVEISPGQITQARNSSLQLYLRYILWDGRKKKALLPAK